MTISATVTSQPISASVSGDTIAASVPVAAGVAASVAGGVGPQGATGAAGPQGPQGERGLQGDTGPAGASGASNWSEIAGKPETFPPTSHNHTASQITDFAAAVAAAAPPTTDASLLTSGTLADARLSGNVVLTNDARMTNSRTPTSHAASHATGGGDPLSAADIGAAAANHSHTYASLTAKPVHPYAAQLLFG